MLGIVSSNNDFVTVVSLCLGKLVLMIGLSFFIVPVYTDMYFIIVYLGLLHLYHSFQFVILLFQYLNHLLHSLLIINKFSPDSSISTTDLPTSILVFGNSCWLPSTVTKSKDILFFDRRKFKDLILIIESYCFICLINMVCWMILMALCQ